MTLQQRMKKYAELVGSDKLENYTYNILDDLQAAVRALEVAREALGIKYPKMLYSGDEINHLHSVLIQNDIDPVHVGREAIIHCLAEILTQQDKALNLINQTLGEKQ